MQVEGIQNHGKTVFGQGQVVIVRKSKIIPITWAFF